MGDLVYMPSQCEIRINEHLRKWVILINGREIGVWTDYARLDMAERTAKRKAKLMGFDDPIMTYIVSR